MTPSKKAGALLCGLALAAAAALTWSLIGPNVIAYAARLAEDPEVRAWNPNPPITSILSSELPPDKTVWLGDLGVSLSTTPLHPIAGEETRFIWRVTDREGRPAELHRIMHGIAMHVYAVREDIAGEVIHMHPAQREGSADWRDLSTFASAGTWQVHMQGTHHGVLYDFWSPLEVKGPSPTQPAPPDESLVRTRAEYEVRLELGAPPRSGVPTKVRFNVRHTPELDPAQIASNARVQHNLIVAKQGWPILWNHHGDGSVDGVAAQAPVMVNRRYSDTDPFDYDLTFPSPGLWLIYFEYMAESTQFAVRVK